MGFAIILVVTLIFVGIAFLEAKKPQKPEEAEWEVEFLGEDEAAF